MKITLKNQQTLLDVALMYGGDITKVFQIAESNSYPIDSILDNHTVEVPDFSNSTQSELSKFLQYQNTVYTTYPNL